MRRRRRGREKKIIFKKLVKWRNIESKEIVYLCVCVFVFVWAKRCINSIFTASTILSNTKTDDYWWILFLLFWSSTHTLTNCCKNAQTHTLTYTLAWIMFTQLSESIWPMTTFSQSLIHHISSRRRHKNKEEKYVFVSVCEFLFFTLYCYCCVFIIVRTRLIDQHTT